MNIECCVQQGGGGESREIGERFLCDKRVLYITFFKYFTDINECEILVQ